MKDNNKVLERVKQGIAHHEKCVARRITGFDIGMRVNHQTFGKGEIIHVLDRIGGLALILIREESLPTGDILGWHHLFVIGKNLHARQNRCAPFIAINCGPIAF